MLQSQIFKELSDHHNAWYHWQPRSDSYKASPTMVKNILDISKQITKTAEHFLNIYLLFSDLSVNWSISALWKELCTDKDFWNAPMLQW